MATTNDHELVQKYREFDELCERRFEGLHVDLEISTTGGPVPNLIAQSFDEGGVGEIKPEVEIVFEGGYPLLQIKHDSLKTTLSWEAESFFEFAEWVLEVLETKEELKELQEQKT